MQDLLFEAAWLQTILLFWPKQELRSGLALVDPAYVIEGALWVSSLCISWTKTHKTHLYKPSCALTKTVGIISVNAACIENLLFLIIFLPYFYFQGDAVLYNEE